MPQKNIQIDIGNIRGLQAKHYKNNNFNSLEEYTDDANHIIAKYGDGIYIGLSAELLSNDDAITNIATAMMIADWNYNEKRSIKCSRTTHMIKYALWEMYAYVTRKTKTLKTHTTLETDFYCDNGITDKKCGYIDLLEDKKQIQDIKKYLDTQDMTQKIKKSSLSKTQKKHIIEFYINGLSAEKIATKYNLTRAGVYSSLQKARTILQQEVYN